MHLLIDVQALQSPHTRQRGIGRYVANLLHAMADVGPPWRIELVQNAHFDPVSRPMPFPILTFAPPLRAAGAHVAANEQFYGDWLSARGADAVLVASWFDEDVLVPRFVGKRPRLAAVLYDLIPLLFHEQALRTPHLVARYGDCFRRLLDADNILAISEASATDLRASSWTRTGFHPLRGWI
jgi:hypothetical protein